LNTGQMVAVKRISLSGLKEEEISQLMKEVDLLKSLSHPGIVKYEGMARDEDTLSIVLEYAASVFPYEMLSDRVLDLPKTGLWVRRSKHLVS
jgi:serine/threonine protein kinase